MLAGCGGGSSSADPGPAPARRHRERPSHFRFRAGRRRRAGSITPRRSRVPARGVTVELLQNGAVTASTTTDATGNYSFGNVGANTDVALRVRAEMLRVGAPSWDFRVVDNVNGDALYTLAGAVFNTGTANITRNLHAASGWTGAAYTATRSAAPFAILDVAYDAVQLVLTAAPSTAFPALRFHWSTAERAGRGHGVPARSARAGSSADGPASFSSARPIKTPTSTTGTSSRTSSATISSIASRAPTASAARTR